VHRLLIPLGLALSLTLASCSSDEDCASAAGVAQSCAAALGDAVYPSCNDTGGCGPDAGPGESTKVWRLRGVPPEQVIVGRSQLDDGFVVLGRLGVDPEDYFRLDRHGHWHLRAG
jgi:hypothetical protein